MGREGGREKERPLLSLQERERERQGQRETAVGLAGLREDAAAVHVHALVAELVRLEHHRARRVVARDDSRHARARVVEPAAAPSARPRVRVCAGCVVGACVGVLGVLGERGLPERVCRE